eukprot:scaffold311456_cov28-Tisochrysis_lutea.AAC.2
MKQKFVSSPSRDLEAQSSHVLSASGALSSLASSTSSTSHVGFHSSTGAESRWTAFAQAPEACAAKSPLSRPSGFSAPVLLVRSSWLRHSRMQAAALGFRSMTMNGVRGRRASGRRRRASWARFGRPTSARPQAAAFETCEAAQARGASCGDSGAPARSQSPAPLGRVTRHAARAGRAGGRAGKWDLPILPQQGCEGA